MNAKRIGVTIAALAVLAAGCGRLTDEGPGAGGSGGSGTTGGGAISHPTGADELSCGSSIKAASCPTSSPCRACPCGRCSATARSITQGPIGIYPQPALPSLVRTPITEDGVQAILEAARDAGLMDGDANYGDQCIADVATTVFTTNANGTTSVVSAYALDAGEPAGTCGGKEDARARAALAEFQTELGDLKSWLPQGSVGEETAFEPTEMRVYVLHYQGDPELPQTAMDWPLETPLSAFGEPLADGPETRCGVITGDDFEQVYGAAQAANQLTPWVSDGTRSGSYSRPLLPDEHTC